MLKQTNRSVRLQSTQQRIKLFEMRRNVPHNLGVHYACAAVLPDLVQPYRKLAMGRGQLGEHAQHYLPHFSRVDEGVGVAFRGKLDSSPFFCR